MGDSAAEDSRLIAAGRQVAAWGVHGIVVAQPDPTLASEPERHRLQFLGGRR